MSSTPYLNLGIVSAYADAKRGGYAGTYDEFCAALAAIGAYSNDNILDNWYFPNPVNQRGQAEYTGSGISNVYGIDRWAVQFDGTKYTVATAVLSTTSETNVGQMNYMLPNNEAMQFVGKQMTFSLLVDNPDGVNVTLNVRDRTRWSQQV